jgi:hypothetical protein
MNWIIPYTNNTKIDLNKYNIPYSKKPFDMLGGFIVKIEYPNIKLTKCECVCHGYENIKHIVACCQYPDYTTGCLNIGDRHDETRKSDKHMDGIKCECICHYEKNIFHVKACCSLSGQLYNQKTSTNFGSISGNDF